MDVLIMAEKHDELLSDLPVEWLVQEPKEITSHWLQTSLESMKS